MKVISFSAVEILPSLLNKSKVQTLRPAWNEPKVKRFKSFDEERGQIHDILFDEAPYEKPARFKVGEVVQLVWKAAAGYPKNARFCRKCGKLSNPEACEVCSPTIQDYNTFPKLFGTAEITSVDKMSMKFARDGILVTLNGETCDFGNALHLSWKDGFGSVNDFYHYFLSNYDLSTEKPFWVYRWRWL